MAEAGKSYGEGSALGSRRKAQVDGKVRVRAPRHFRKLGRRYMDDVTDAEIAKVYFGYEDFDKVLARKVKDEQTAKGQITRLEKKIADAKEAGTETSVFEADKNLWNEKLNSYAGSMNEIIANIAAFRQA